MQWFKVCVSLLFLLGWASLAAGTPLPDKLDPRAAEKPADGQPVADWMLLMVRKGGYGPQGGKTISEFRVNKAGRYVYDGVSGQMPKKELEALLKALAKADKGPAAEDAGSVAFYGRGDKGEPVLLILFTLPSRAPDCLALIKRIAELSQTYKDKQ